MQQERILIVDVDPDIVSFLAEVLEDDGYLVQTALDGPGALQCIPVFAPDVLLVERFLPFMDGDTLVEQVLGMDGHRPAIVLMTTNPRSVAAISAMDGIVCLLKPFHLDDLLVCIQTALEGRPVQQHLPAAREFGRE